MASSRFAKASTANKQLRVGTDYGDDDSAAPPLILLCDVCGAGRHVKCLPTEMVPDWRHLPGERVEALYNGKWYGCTVVRMRATDADVAVDGGEWTVEVATEMRAATAAVPSQTQQLAEVSGLRWVGETPPAIAIAECEKAEGARAEGGERKRKREGCGL